MNQSIIFILSAILALVFAAATLLLILKASNRTTALYKRLEEQETMISDLTRMYNTAVEYNRTRMEFFTNITHELKTPLSVILGGIQLMEQRNSLQVFEQSKYGKHLKTMKQNCYRMLRLINNILDMARIDSGYARVNQVNLNMVSVIEEITQSVAPFAEQKGIHLDFNTEKETIVTAADMDKIERILLNLLSNAIKFAQRGGHVSVSIKQAEQKILVSVKDDGPGIPKSMHEEIFERFRQVGGKSTVDAEGTGIGLSLVKYFVELQGGSISLISEENKGCEFIIEFPIRILQGTNGDTDTGQKQNRIIESINIEFSDINDNRGESTGHNEGEGSKSAG